MTYLAARVPPPAQPEGILAVDVGQSSTHFRLGGPGGVTASAAGVDTSRPVVPQIAAAINAFLRQSGARPTAVGVGASGLDDAGADELLALLDTSVTSAALAHDSTTWYLGAHGDAPGVIIACGTGVVTLAMGLTEVARVDGWGWVMGDAGSAYWIGRNALEAAMRGYDGRRQLTALTDVVLADFDDIERAYLELQADENRVSRIARYARIVDALAPTDPVAANILDKAAAHLSEAVFAAASRVGLVEHQPPRVCAVGQTFSSTRLLNRFTGFLTLQWPNFALAEPKGNALDGAAALVQLDESSPLEQRVKRAHR